MGALVQKSEKRFFLFALCKGTSTRTDVRFTFALIANRARLLRSRQNARKRQRGDLFFSLFHILCIFLDEMKKKHMKYTSGEKKLRRQS